MALRYRLRMTTADEAIARARTGARIRELRKQQKMSGAVLAAWIGCTDSHVYNIEAGRSAASGQLRESIAKALGVEVEDLERAS